ncbi:MAG: hypothetical protein LBL79_15220 [Prevotella sp.]|jgi:hypothetical protein|nr:hypothetical protein [Prevotella sp.]
MRRYYSHYTFIYPDTYVKNCIVEMDDNRKILRFFPFTKEMEKTEFYTGHLLFLPLNDLFTNSELNNLVSGKYFSIDTKKENFDSNIRYGVYTLDGDTIL